MHFVSPPQLYHYSRMSVYMCQGRLVGETEQQEQEEFGKVNGETATVVLEGG